MKIEKGQHYIVRANGAGVFFGEIDEVNGQTVEMRNARKLWSWEGANAVEELAVHGTTRAADCRFTVFVEEMTIFNAVQILKCTKEAVKSINEVAVWSKK